MNQELYPRTALALKELLLAFADFQACMRVDFPEGCDSPDAPSLLLVAHDPQAGGTHFKLSGDAGQVCRSLATALTNEQPVYQEMNRELLRLLAWHQMNQHRQN